MTNDVAAPSVSDVSSEISLTVCPESNCNVPVSCTFVAPVRFPLIVNFVTPVTFPATIRFPVDVMFPVFIADCPDTFIFPETTPVSVVVIKLNRSSLSSQIIATFVLDPHSVTNPES